MYILKDLYFKNKFYLGYYTITTQHLSLYPQNCQREDVWCHHRWRQRQKHCVQGDGRKVGAENGETRVTMQNWVDQTRIWNNINWDLLSFFFNRKNLHGFNLVVFYACGRHGYLPLDIGKAMAIWCRCLISIRVGTTCTHSSKIISKVLCMC